MKRTEKAPVLTDFYISITGLSTLSSLWLRMRSSVLRTALKLRRMIVKKCVRCGEKRSLSETWLRILQERPYKQTWHLETTTQCSSFLVIRKVLKGIENVWQCTWELEYIQRLNAAYINCMRTRKGIQTHTSLWDVNLVNEIESNVISSRSKMIVEWGVVR